MASQPAQPHSYSCWSSFPNFVAQCVIMAQSLDVVMCCWPCSWRFCFGFVHHGALNGPTLGQVWAHDWHMTHDGSMMGPYNGPVIGQYWAHVGPMMGIWPMMGPRWANEWSMSIP